MSKKPNTNHPNVKEQLFNDFFNACFHTMESLELTFGVSNVVNQIFGTTNRPMSPKEAAAAKAKLRDSHAWQCLDRLYEYAVNGIEDAHEDGSSITIDGSNVIKLSTSEDWSPCAQWEQLIWMSDGRFALDDYQPVDSEKIALLAKVDLRTVRNAISAGELIAEKDQFSGRTNIENGSARRWLMTRKGFKPTVSQEAGRTSLDEVQTPAEFGAFLKCQRVAAYGDGSLGTLVPRHPKVKADTITSLEAGIFDLSIDAAFPLADFYQLPRKQFLDSVMRVLFPDELAMLGKDGAQ